MSFFDDVKQKATHALFEDTGGAPSPVPPPKPTSPTPPLVVTPPMVMTVQGGMVDAVTDTTSALYQSLKKNTDFDMTPAGSTIKKFMDPLAPLNLDEKTKLKTAALQAGAQGGLTVEAILATFDQLKLALQGERTRFESGAKDFEQSEITARKAGMDSLTAQINETQDRLSQLLTTKSQLAEALQTAQAKLAERKTKFANAVSLRESELTQQQAHLSDMLKG